MGFRFRKSINLGGGFRVNLSKSGIGYSWGTKGFRVTKTAKGKGRVTASIPGTGISYVAESGGKRKRRSKVVRKPIPQAQVSTENYKIPPALALLAVACGIGFVVYYVSQGWSIGLSIGSGVVMGGLSYLAICFLYGAVAGGIKSATGYDIVKTAAEESTEQVQENSSVQIANDGETQIEVFEIPGAFHNRANIAKVMEPNPAWRKTCKVLIKSGIGDKRVYRFRPTTRSAQLVAEPNNPYSDNAVMVQIDGLKVGYIADDEDFHVKDILENKTIVDVSAEITGGEYKLILSEEKMVKYTVGPFIKVTVQYH